MPLLPPVWRIAYYEEIFVFPIYTDCRSQWPRGLRRSSAAARLLRLWAWMSVCCECCQVEVSATN